MSLLGYNDYQRQQSSSPIMHRTPIGTSSNAGAPTPFKAPAHKHAHHLHSIPPREKSTRTLIIDHLLWVHGRTRFAQARAELGMTDRTGGPSSPNFAQRERPENYEEEEEMYSEGEEVVVLTARAGGPGHPHGDEEEEWLERQDLRLARSMRQRAEGVEKVATSMLDQPPEVPPLHPDDLLETPTSPQLRPQATSPHQHILPNGVRLRLALATVVNDLFSRRAPIPPARHHSAQPTSAPLLLPSALAPLMTISSSAVNPRAATPNTRRPHPTDYIRSLYNVGAEEDNQNSPPSLRCPRHLHMGCEICVEPKSQISSRGGGSRGRNIPGRTASSTGSSPDAMANHGSATLMGGVTGWQDGSGIGSGLERPGQRGTVLRRPSGVATANGNVNAMSNTKLAELIVRFMRLSALVAMELGREATEDRVSVDGGERRDEDGTAPAQASSSSTPRPPMSPRPLAHRQLAADAGLFYHALRPSREWYFLLAGLLTRAVFEGYMTAGWRGIEPLEVLLGVGLCMAHPKQHPPQALTSNGNRSASNSHQNGHQRKGGEAGAEDDDFAEFDPDDLPDLEDAARVLFPSLREVGVGPSGVPYYRREGAELEYEAEMMDRLSRFYDVPGSTPDLATHMEDLAWQFPAEVVERAAVRFCEAVARWRGKPELETYKKAPWVIGQRERRISGGAAMSIDALVHSNPTSPSSTADHVGVQSPYHPEPPKSSRPPIERYFTVPQTLLIQGRKRRRSDTDRVEEGRRGF